MKQYDRSGQESGQLLLLLLFCPFMDLDMLHRLQFFKKIYFSIA